VDEPTKKPTQEETAEYISALLAQLGKMALVQQQTTLAHVLWLAKQEAERLRNRADVEVGKLPS
jgi:cytosine/adenosine deaminase-related metal-dependent hydrolase